MRRLWRYSARVSNLTNARTADCAKANSCSQLLDTCCLVAADSSEAEEKLLESWQIPDEVIRRTHLVCVTNVARPRREFSQLNNLAANFARVFQWRSLESGTPSIYLAGRLFKIVQNPFSCRHTVKTKGSTSQPPGTVSIGPVRSSRR